MSQPALTAIAASLYSPILLARVWLAWSKFLKHSSDGTNALAAVASLFFLLSDSYLSVNRFYLTLPYHQEFVMVTYYLAQAVITLTVLCQPKNGKKKK